MASSQPAALSQGMKFAPRLLHRRLSPWLIAPLLLVVATGMTYRIGRSWFGMDRDTGHRILDFHTGSVIGDGFSLVYTAVVGLSLLTLALSGTWLLWRSRAKKGARRWHRMIAWVLLPPLIATSVTGMGYHFGELVFDFEESTLKLLMTIHQGSWLGPKLRPFYIILVGGGLLMLIVTGVSMLRGKSNRTK